jgi:hypothetical protein
VYVCVCICLFVCVCVYVCVCVKGGLIKRGRERVEGRRVREGQVWGRKSKRGENGGNIMRGRGGRG